MSASVEAALRELLDRRRQERPRQESGIAIVGIALRFPGSNCPTSLWSQLLEGRNNVTQAPPFEVRGTSLPLCDEQPAVGSTEPTRRGGYLTAVDQFDARFFGVSKLEAEQLDPQQRLLMEVAVEALDDAGCPHDRLRGSETGVFVGICHSDFADLQMAQHAKRNLYTNTGGALSIAANRISYFLDLKGPSMAVDTACSSSLVAVNLAEQQLQSKTIDLALVGGSNLLLNDRITEGFRSLFALSPRSACRAFDSSADGFVRSEGVAFVVLKRLADAVRDGDRVYAVIASSAVNNDGATNGLTAPSQVAQCEAIRKALRIANAVPEDILFVEAHGSGTPLGDAIELGALDEVFGTGRTRELWIGSIKSNLGHMEAAAGIGGLIKAALSIHHGVLPPSIHFEHPNEAMTRTGCMLRVPTMPVPLSANGGAILGGISSFGLGGTNAHVILRSAPAALDPDRSPTLDHVAHLILLSAASPQALHEKAVALLDKVRLDGEKAALSRLANASQTRQSHLSSRIGFVVHDIRELEAHLHSFTERHSQGSAAAVGRAPSGRRKAPSVAVIYTGDVVPSEQITCSSVWGIEDVLGADLLERPGEGADQSAIPRSAFAKADIVIRIHAEADRLQYGCSAIGVESPTHQVDDLDGSASNDLHRLQLMLDLYQLGAAVPWEKISGRGMHSSAIPRYAWQRQRYWPSGMA